MLAGRVKSMPFTTPGSGDPVQDRLSRPILEYLQRFYADTANFGNPIALRAALDFFGTEHVLFGSDFGFSPTFLPETLDDIEQVVADEDLKRQLYEGNARRLLRLGEVPAAV
jgi:aminocarboxymuconate-semialdehyde decarboxylase